jgi:hypothetical protein
MTANYIINKLEEAVKLSEIHFQRMHYAYGKVQYIFPLDADKYSNLTYDDLSYFDQLIFRFSKLQDSMGTRLFPALLENLGEDINDIPFIDLLNRLEKLKIIEDSRQWLTLRETRNIVTHEYPFDPQDIVDALNILEIQVLILENILNNINEYVKNRFGI